MPEISGPLMNPANPAAEVPRTWTIGGLLNWTARFLAQKGSEFPRLDAEVLLAHALQCRRIELYTRFDEPAPDAVRETFRELVRRRVEGCPVAYLVGRKEFFSLELEVSPAVLIPRPESEFVVLECVRLAKTMADPRILDIGTGSGNIAVAVARQLPRARVTAADISPEALAVAQRNALRHAVQERVEFILSDLFGSIGSESSFDFILSNPPYIATEELPRLPSGVKNYEPKIALNGGDGGFAVFDRLLAGATRYLKIKGYFIVEIGAPQEASARQRIGQYGNFLLAPTNRDYSGHPRVLTAQRTDL
jgi:release factor glutamine methyltransferase